MKTTIATGLLFLLICSFVGLPSPGWALTSVASPTGEFTNFPLENAIKEVAEQHQVNVIMTHDVGTRLISASLGNEPVARVLSNLAEIGGIGVVEDQGIFVFSSKNKIGEFPSFPLLKGIPNPSLISLNFSAADIRDVASLIREKCDYNIILGKSVRGNTSLRLVEVAWPLALHHLAAAFGFECRLQGKTVLIWDKHLIEGMVPSVPPAEKNSPKISFQFKNTDIRDIFGVIARRFSRDFITGVHVRGNVTISLKDVGETEAAQILAGSNGFAGKKIQNIWFLNDQKILEEGDKTLQLPEAPKDDNVLSLEFREASVRNIFHIVSQKSGLKIGVTPGVNGTITLRLTDRSAFDILRTIAGAHGWSIKSDGKTVLIAAIGEETAAPEFQ